MSIIANWFFVGPATSNRINAERKHPTTTRTKNNELTPSPLFHFCFHVPEGDDHSQKQNLNKRYIPPQCKASDHNACVWLPYISKGVHSMGDLSAPLVNSVLGTLSNGTFITGKADVFKCQHGYTLVNNIITALCRACEHSYGKLCNDN